MEEGGGPGGNGGFGWHCKCHARMRSNRLGPRMESIKSAREEQLGVQDVNLTSSKKRNPRKIHREGDTHTTYCMPPHSSGNIDVTTQKSSDGVREVFFPMGNARPNSPAKVAVNLSRCLRIFKFSLHHPLVIHSQQSLLLFCYRVTNHRKPLTNNSQWNTSGTRRQKSQKEKIETFQCGNEVRPSALKLRPRQIKTKTTETTETETETNTYRDIQDRDI